MFRQCRILNKTDNSIFYGQIDTNLVDVPKYNLVQIPDDGKLYIWNGTEAIEDIATETLNTNKLNLTNSFLETWSSLPLYWQHNNDSIKIAVLNYISVWDLTSLNNMATDTTVPTSEQPFQQQLLALLQPYLPVSPTNN